MVQWLGSTWAIWYDNASVGKDRCKLLQKEVKAEAKEMLINSVKFSFCLSTGHYGKDHIIRVKIRHHYIFLFLSSRKYQMSISLRFVTYCKRWVRAILKYDTGWCRSTEEPCRTPAGLFSRFTNKYQTCLRETNLIGCSAQHCKFLLVNLTTKKRHTP